MARRSRGNIMKCVAEKDGVRRWAMFAKTKKQSRKAGGPTRQRPGGCSPYSVFPVDRRISTTSRAAGSCRPSDDLGYIPGNGTRKAITMGASRAHDCPAASLRTHFCLTLRDQFARRGPVRCGRWVWTTRGTDAFVRAGAVRSLDFGSGLPVQDLSKTVRPGRQAP